MTSCAADHTAWPFPFAEHVWAHTPREVQDHMLQLLAATEVRHLYPVPCACGPFDLNTATPYHTHQVVELPPIEIEVTHFGLHQVPCVGCGRLRKAEVPSASATGYGPRLTALIGELAGVHGTSRRLLQDFCASVLHLPMSLGAVQKVIDRQARLCKLLDQYQERADDAGRLVRRLVREMASLWVLLCEQGVEPTHNDAERALRFAVLLRKRQHGTASEKGNHWVERSLSLRQTCRQRGQSTFTVLVDAITSFFHGHQPNLSWLY